MNIPQFDLTCYIYVMYLLFGLWGFILFSWEWTHRGASFVFKWMTILFLGISIRYSIEIYERLYTLEYGTHSYLWTTLWWPGRNIISLIAIGTIVAVMTVRAVKRNRNKEGCEDGDQN